MEKAFDEYNRRACERMRKEVDTGVSDFGKVGISKQTVPRLELEWVKPRRDFNIMQLMQKFSKVSKVSLSKRAEELRGFLTERVAKKEIKEMKRQEDEEGKKSVSPRTVNVNNFSLKGWGWEVVVVSGG